MSKRKQIEGRHAPTTGGNLQLLRSLNAPGVPVPDSRSAAETQRVRGKRVKKILMKEAFFEA
ncbi:hypothetical protein RRSWK_02474 [Rhodopirellula sp. SWK7]|nr:hypothetical protein RRSWK_02474 [Rhodopirellula sp. SWK7]